MSSLLGTASLYLVDEARTEPLLGAAARRPVGVQLIYPAAGPLERGIRIPDRADWLAAAAGWLDEEPRILAEKYGPLPAVGGDCAPPVAGRFPLLLFSPGGYQSRHVYAGLAAQLAAAGYVVALVSHAFAGLDMFPGHGLVGRHPHWSQAHGPERDAVLEEMTDCLAADARFVIDRLLDGSLSSGGMIDPAHIGIIGHSRGGRTVSRTASTDTRIGAAVIYDALPPARERSSGFRQPLLLMRVADPENDHHWREGTARWPPERLAALSDLLSSNQAPIHDCAISGIGHMNFSDRAAVEPSRFLSRLSAARATAIIVALTLAFLDRHLKGLDSDVAVTASLYPEVRLTGTVA
jgi:dienelactone hydrolase